MKTVILKVITLMFITSLLCGYIHYNTKKEIDEFRYRMIVNERHLDSTYKSINSNLDNIQKNFR